MEAIAAQKPKEKKKELTAEEKRVAEAAAFKAATRRQVGVLILGGMLMALIGAFAPPAFMGHFIVFVLACFIGFQVIWGVSHALHTPLMAITNAISGIIIIGAVLQINAGGWLLHRRGYIHGIGRRLWQACWPYRRQGADSAWPSCRISQCKDRGISGST